MATARGAITCHAATPSRWRDVERLFGERGACAGCWCMWPRLRGAEFARGRGAGNKRALRRLVAGGGRPGIIAYRGGEPVGWCAVAPREQYTRLERSRVMAPVDDQPVWSVVCFFVTPGARRSGVTTALLRAAVDRAARGGARIVEGYPLDSGGRKLADAFAWFGLASAFERAGFKEMARRSKTRPIMRRSTRGAGGGAGRRAAGRPVGRRRPGAARPRPRSAPPSRLRGPAESPRRAPARSASRRVGSRG